MTEHKTFRITSIVSFVIILTITIIYNYLLTINSHDITLFILKPIPLLILIINVVTYFIIYRIHVYALLIEISFLLCLIGDIFLMFYVPPIPKYDNVTYLILGGGAFLIARIFMCLAYGISPFDNNGRRCIDVNVKKIIFAGLFGFIWTCAMCIYFGFNMNSEFYMKILIIFYLVIMGVNLVMALVRIKGFKEETLSSQIFGVAGTVLFTISDNLLLWNIFIKTVPYGDVISINIYWIGMFFIMISTVRTNSVEREKINVSMYLPLTTESR